MTCFTNFGVWGAPGGGLEEKLKKQQRGNLLSLCFGDHVGTFSTFSMFFKSAFSCIFQWSIFRHFRPIWCPKVSQSEVLGANVDDILGEGSTCENRCFVRAGAQSGRFWRVQEPSSFKVFF